MPKVTLTNADSSTTEYGLKKKLLLTANQKKGWMKREFVDPFKAGILAISRKFVSSLATDNTSSSK
jgi:hypothetical protein